MRPTGVIFLCVFVAVTVAAYCEMVSVTMPSATPTPEGAETAYTFKAETVWGRLDVLVRDTSDRFQVEVQSTTPSSGWILYDEKAGKNISKGGLNPARKFRFDCAGRFEDPYRLTVFLIPENEEVPYVLRISPSSALPRKTFLADDIEPFKDFPDRPYNSMVRTFYEIAGENYSKGDKRSASEALLKASELDPENPQVRAFQVKLWKEQGAFPSTQTPSDPKPTDPKTPAKRTSRSKASSLLAKATRAEKRGQFSIAVENLKEVLTLVPDHPKALKAVERLDTENNVKKLEKALDENDLDSARVAMAILKDLAVDDPRLGPWEARLRSLEAPDPSETAAKADRAYNLGLESYRQEDYAAAKKFWEETLLIDPRHEKAKRNLARLQKTHPNLP